MSPNGRRDQAIDAEGVVAESAEGTREQLVNPLAGDAQRRADVGERFAVDDMAFDNCAFGGRECGE